MPVSTTKEKLLQIGREEFLTNGYKDASLREIVKKAGFTLGAFYGYYESKEALFEDIVGGAAKALYETYAASQAHFASMEQPQKVAELDSYSDDVLGQMLDILYADLPAFQLLFFRAAGTRYEGYIQRLIDVEIDSTHRFIAALRTQGHNPQVDDAIIHILASAMFSGMVEVVDHAMPKQQAARYIAQLRQFYSAGWHKLLGV